MNKSRQQDEWMRMRSTARQRGFSLTEVLLATGVLAVGFAMVAMVFPVGMTLTGAAVERNIGPVAAQEAEAKVRLYGVDWAGGYWGPDQNGRDHMKIYNWENIRTGANPLPLAIYSGIIDPGVYASLDPLLTAQGLTVPARLHEESFYPSLPDTYYLQNPQETRRYRWTVMGLRTGLQELRMVAFICRKTAEGARYYGVRNYNPTTDTYTARADLTWPMPVRVRVLQGTAANEIVIDAANQTFPLADCLKFFTDDCQVVDDKNGRVYRVVERRDDGGDGSRETLVLQEPWDLNPPVADEAVWVVPPALGGGRNPCIGIYPFVIN